MTADSSGDACTLCGLPVPSEPIENDAGEQFCCVGCREVSASLADIEEVDEADIRAAVQADEDDGLSESGMADHPPEGCERTFLQVDGMHCTTCEAFLKTIAESQSGVEGATASYVTESVRIDHDPEQTSVEDLTDALSRSGYEAINREDPAAREREEEGFPYRVVIGIMLAMYVMLPYVVYVYPVHFAALYPDWMLETLEGHLEGAWYLFLVIWVFTTAILWYTGKPILRGALVSLRARQPNMDLLVTIAALGAYFYSIVAIFTGGVDIYFDVTIAIVLVVTVGSYYESRVKRQATELLSELTTAQVEEARRYEPDGSTTEVSVGELEPGETVLVREGERIPIDGTVRDGTCTVDEAVVTGESLPVRKEPGDEVVGGSVLVEEAAVVEVGEDADSSLDRIVELVWNLQTSSGGVQKLANRLAVIFVPTVVVLSILAGTIHFALGADFPSALLVALTVVIVSCPCALGLATPLAVATSIREAMERGIVVFDDTVFERLRNVDVVVFDKTGTLTTGRMDVLDAPDDTDLLEAAALLERRSSHPAAEAIAEAFGPWNEPADDDATRVDGGVVESETGQESPPTADEFDDRVTDFESHALGVEGVVDGVEVLVGHPDLFTERGWAVPEQIAERTREVRERGQLPVVAGRDGNAEGVVVVGDEPREGWDETVKALDERGIEVVVLTGDEHQAAQRFREHPGIGQVFAGVPPEGKAETVRRLGAGRQVAMVGDGTNDAPALARADLGIALGSGTALAADAADVAIVDDDLSSVETVFDLAAAAGRRVKQNAGWAFAYNAIVIPVAVVGLLNPLIAAAAMATSSALVVTNSSRELLPEPLDR